MAKAKKKKKILKNIVHGAVHIKATFNNTIVTISDSKGNVIVSTSAGANGFKGTRKSTPFAAQLVAESATKEAMEHGMKEVDILVKGPGAGRESAIRTIHTSGIEVIEIVDVTPLPHNGCRPPNRRRV